MYCNKIRDSVTRIRHMYWLYSEMKKGTRITEKSSVQKLNEIRRLKKFLDIKFFF